MRCTPIVLALALALVPAAASADAQVTIVAGGGAVASFEHVSADGCVVTVGEIAVLQTQHGGELGDGIFVAGSQADSCAGTGLGFLEFVEGGAFAVNGLGSASYTGSFVIEAYNDGTPFSFDLDLQWTGTGAVSRQRGSYRDGDVIEFSYGSSRAATTSGTFTVDGGAVTVSSARLIRQTSGTITH